jgi:hypothetical protein
MPTNKSHILYKLNAPENWLIGVTCPEYNTNS